MGLTSDTAHTWQPRTFYTGVIRQSKCFPFDQQKMSEEVELEWETGSTLEGGKGISMLEDFWTE